MNTKILKYAFISGAVIGIIAAVLIIKNKGKDERMEPEAVVQTFSKALAEGDFETAVELCDTVSMKEYLENYIILWNKLQQDDSTALAIASSILGDSALTIEKSEKAEGGRMIYYSIEAGGVEKRKTAKLKKEEGEWRVETITDRI